MRKNIITFFIIGVSCGATLLASVFIPKLKTKQELPEVIINGQPTGVRGYTTNFVVETQKFCPRDTPNPEYTYTNGNAENAVVFVKHCTHCSIGVYSEHDEESEQINGKPVRRCTYCGDKEKI